MVYKKYLYVCTCVCVYVYVYARSTSKNLISLNFEINFIEINDQFVINIIIIINKGKFIIEIKYKIKTWTIPKFPKLLNFE